MGSNGSYLPLAPLAEWELSPQVFNTWDDHEITDDWGCTRLEALGQVLARIFILVDTLCP
jgi:hypothetical protein